MTKPVIAAGCGPHYERSDGVTFEKGDWIEIVDRGVGKFMGVWHQDNGVIMSSLSFWRSFADPSERDTFWIGVGKIGAEVKPCLLDTAFKVDGPLSPKGKRPTRIQESA